MQQSPLTPNPSIIQSTIHYPLLQQGRSRESYILIMKELKKVYGQFEILKRSAENGLSKVAYSSLDKYTRSPYLQKITIQTNRRPTHRETTPNNRPPSPHQQPEPKPKHPHLELPKLTTPVKRRQPEPTSYFKTELDSAENPLVVGKASIGTHSATLEVSKGNKLEPLQKGHKVGYVVKTKAGTNGKQPKTNQDMAMVDVKLPFGIKFFGVCDGHGVNGHHVSAFIKTHLLKSLNFALKSLPTAPSSQELQTLINHALQKTNKQLLEGDINTELSGSTVVAVALYNSQVLCFNVGDSRAIMLRQTTQEKEKEAESENSDHSFIDFKFNNRLARHHWTTLPLTSDHKPDRPDERQRILDFGGRIFSQKNERGEDLGPLRVWMKDVAMPGLAMTRSFGDKAGVKAGTNGQAEMSVFELNGEERFLVIASDGIWEYLENDEVMTLVIPFQQHELEAAAERLVKVATEIWQKVSFSRDDITVVLVGLHPK